MIAALIPLLNALARVGHALANLITSVSLAAWLHAAELEAISKWLQSTPEEQQKIMQQLPPLSEEQEALLVEFQHRMDTQYQIQLLKRYILTLPALPEEGF